nr:MAG TPA: hypothetical protein [Caudoviricetes sp.]
MICGPIPGYVSIRTGSSDMFARVFSGSLTSAAKR